MSGRLLTCGAACGLVAGALPARADSWDSYTVARLSLNPGVHVSYTVGRDGGFGLGLGSSLMFEVRDGWQDPFQGAGPLLQHEWLFHGAGAPTRTTYALRAAITPDSFEHWQGGGLEIGYASLGSGRKAIGAGHAAAFLAAPFLGLGIRGTLPGQAGSGQLAVVLAAQAPLALGFGQAVAGRPLRSGEGILLPAVVGVAGGATGSVGGDLRDEERGQLRDRWLRAARAEDASIPAFLRLARDLAAAGAPPALIAACHRAACDEARHADIAFGIAGALGESRYAAIPIVPGSGADHRAPDRTAELARLATEAFLDGCIGEGSAGALARTSASGTEDGAIRSALTTIAADEERHAELAWRVLAWCLDQDRRGVSTALRAAIDRSREVPPPGDPDDPMPRHGWAGARVEASVAALVCSRARERLLDRLGA